MLVRCDIGHDFIAVDGPALGASFTMGEDFVCEIEHGFAIDAAHEIGGVGRCHIGRTRRGFLLEKRHETPPSPSLRDVFTLQMQHIGVREHQLSFADGEEKIGG